MFIVTNLSQLTAYLRALRRARGLTQADLGARLGVSKARISHIERNPDALTSALLLKVLQVLGARLMIDTDAPEPSKTARGRRAASAGQW